MSEWLGRSFNKFLRINGGKDASTNEEERNRLLIMNDAEGQ